MTSGITRLEKFLLGIVTLVSLPCLYYSLNTPFALVDDYTDWRFSGILHGGSQFVGYLKWAFLGVDRFRPGYELGNAVHWMLFGDHYGIHHLVRWVERLALFGFLWAFFRQAVGPSGRFGFWVMLGLFWFVPNCPDARLVPQELTSILFLAGCYFYCARLRMVAEGSLDRLKRKDYWGFLLCYLCLSWAKEPNVLFLGVLLLWMVLILSKPYTLRPLVHLLPFAGIALFTLARVGIAQRTMFPGAPFFDPDLARSNWKALVEYSLIADYRTIAIAIAVVGAVVLRKTKDGDKGSDERAAWRSLGWMHAGVTLMCLFTSLKLPQVVLRYAYPITFCWALAIAWFAQWLWLKTPTPQKRKLAITAAMLCAWFSLAHYQNFVHQYAVQHQAWSSTQRMLDDLEKTLRSEPGRLLVYGSSEEHSKIETYFNHFLPEVAGRSALEAIPNLAPSVDPGSLAAARYAVVLEGVSSNFLAQAPGWQKLETYGSRDAYRMEHWAGKISRLMRWPRRHDFWQDSGANPSVWNVFRK